MGEEEFKVWNHVPVVSVENAKPGDMADAETKEPQELTPEEKAEQEAAKALEEEEAAKAKEKEKKKRGRLLLIAVVALILVLGIEAVICIFVYKPKKAKDVLPEQYVQSLDTFASAVNNNSLEDYYKVFDIDPNEYYSEYEIGYVDHSFAGALENYMVEENKDISDLTYQVLGYAQDYNYTYVQTRFDFKLDGVATSSTQIVTMNLGSQITEWIPLHPLNFEESKLHSFITTIEESLKSDDSLTLVNCMLDETLIYTRDSYLSALIACEYIEDVDIVVESTRELSPVEAYVRGRLSIPALETNVKCVCKTIENNDILITTTEESWLIYQNSNGEYRLAATKMIVDVAPMDYSEFEDIQWTLQERLNTNGGASLVEELPDGNKGETLCKAYESAQNAGVSVWCAIYLPVNENSVFYREDVKEYCAIEFTIYDNQDESNYGDFSARDISGVAGRTESGDIVFLASPDGIDWLLE